jgi:hypothetical protein
VRYVLGFVPVLEVYVFVVVAGDVVAEVGCTAVAGLVSVGALVMGWSCFAASFLDFSGESGVRWLWGAVPCRSRAEKDD